MKPISIREIDDWCEVIINGISMLFTNYRIDRSSLPTGIHAYDIRGDDDSDDDFATLEPRVIVNHTGTVLVKGEISMPDGFCLIIECELGSEMAFDDWLAMRDK